MSIADGYIDAATEYASDGTPMIRGDESHPAFRLSANAVKNGMEARRAIRLAPAKKALCDAAEEWAAGTLPTQALLDAAQEYGEMASER